MKGPFKLKSGNKPSIIKLSGASPMMAKTAEGYMPEGSADVKAKRTPPQVRKLTRQEKIDRKINPKTNVSIYLTGSRKGKLMFHGKKGREEFAIARAKEQVPSEYQNVDEID
jgi:hypothetical protein